MPGQKVKDYLDLNGVKYVTIMHSPAYTAQEVAESAHISGKEMVKSIIIKMDSQFYMAVIPANRKIIFELLMDKFNAAKVQLAREDEFQSIFPDCEIGAMPPFGNLYGIDVIACDYIDKEQPISFNAGSHSEIIRMEFRDYRKLVNPQMANFTT